MTDISMAARKGAKKAVLKADRSVAHWVEWKVDSTALSRVVNLVGLLVARSGVWTAGKMVL